MMAEVYEALGEETKAIPYLDEVRERAGLPGYIESIQNTDYRSKYPLHAYKLLIHQS